MKNDSNLPAPEKRTILEQKRLIMARRAELADYLRMVFASNAMPFEITALDASIQFYKDLEAAFTRKIHVVLCGNRLDESPEAESIRTGKKICIAYKVPIFMKSNFSAEALKKMLADQIACSFINEHGHWFGNIYYDVHEEYDIDVYTIYFCD